MYVLNVPYVLFLTRCSHTAGPSLRCWSVAVTEAAPLYPQMDLSTPSVSDSFIREIDRMRNANASDGEGASI